MRYMLDTNVLIKLIRGDQGKIKQTLLLNSSKDIYISSITVAELMHGAEKSKSPKDNKILVAMALSTFTVVDFDVDAAIEYGFIQNELEREGNLIGTMDMLIAAHARSLDITLVTHNTKDFCRIENLKIEDWQ